MSTKSKLNRAVCRELARIEREGEPPIGSRSRPRKRPQPIEQPRTIEPKKREVQQASDSATQSALPGKESPFVVIPRIVRNRQRGAARHGK
ncbi:MAG: hypothetical protein ACQKBV_05040 [Puniceicoccales bacterium]